MKYARLSWPEKMDIRLKAKEFISLLPKTVWAYLGREMAEGGGWKVTTIFSSVAGELPKTAKDLFGA